MTKPILTYFDFPGGRGEAARLALHLSGIEWVDDRFSGTWPDKKPQTPFGGLPVLTIDGRQLSQSNAILGYIGRTYGLLPADGWEAARHVAVMNAVEELRAEASKTGDDDETEKQRKREAFAEGYLQRWLANLSAEIEGPFVGGDPISVADLKVFVAMRSYQKGVYDYIGSDVLDAHPKVTSLCAAVAEHPAVIDWYTT